jgi:hypothetical protein
MEDEQTNIWQEAIAEGKAIIAEMDRCWWRLAELADKVATSYGENRLAVFAKEIGAVPCTLERRLSTYRRWKEIPAVPPESYAVAQALQAHPNRAEIVAAKPTVTTVEAREMMSQWRQNQTEPADQVEDEEVEDEEVDQEQAAEDQPASNDQAEDDWELEETERWFKRLTALALEIIGEVSLGELTPAKRAILMDVVTPEGLVELREAAEALTKLADDLDQLIENEQNFLTEIVAVAAADAPAMAAE